MLLETRLPRFTIRPRPLQIHLAIHHRRGYAFDNDAPNLGGIEIQPVRFQGHRNPRKQGPELCSQGSPKDKCPLDGHKIHRENFWCRSIDDCQPADVGGPQILPALLHGKYFGFRSRLCSAHGRDSKRPARVGIGPAPRLCHSSPRECLPKSARRLQDCETCLVGTSGGGMHRRQARWRCACLRGHPGYALHLDRDRDGIGCEKCKLPRRVEVLHACTRSWARQASCLGEWAAGQTAPDTAEWSRAPAATCGPALS